MAPAGYRDFFIAAITVTGPLVGLVFVAISVNPRGVGRSGPATMRIRAASSLSAFLDALFVSLVALLPNGSIGVAALVLGLSGGVATITFLVLVIRERQEIRPSQLARTVVLSVGLSAAYVIQAIDGLRLLTGAANSREAGIQAYLVIAFLAFGVHRAWEYVGGRSTGVLEALDAVPHRTNVEEDTQGGPARRG
jgi:hypothetical protein